MTMIQHRGASISFQPRIRKGAFFEAAWRHGCRTFSVYNRTFISSTFSSPAEEYRQVTERVAIWPVMGERQVEVSGPDAAAFVQYLTPRNMARCDVGQCKYALITSAAGGIVSDPIILRLAEDRFWLSTSDCDLELWARAIAAHMPFRVEIRDAGVSVIQVQGPKSPRLMVTLFGTDILDLKYFRLMEAEFEGRTLWISRTGWSGEFGYEIYLPHAEQGDALFDALLDAGRDCQVAPGAVNQARRIEAGILSWGVDMTMEETPFEAGFGHLVELETTPDFMGRAALERLADAPPARLIVGLVVGGDALDPNEDPWPMTFGDRPAGRLTSLAFSPRLGRNIGIGLVPAHLAEPGTRLSVETWSGPRWADVSEMPFLPKRQGMCPHALFHGSAA